MKNALVRAWHLQSGSLVYWQAVCFGTGVCVYFALRFEPAIWLLGAAAALAAGAALAVRSGAAMLILCAVLGFSSAGASARMVAEPVLGFRYYGPIEGRIIKIDRSQSEAVRLTLDNVVLARMSPQRTPTRVRISLHGAQEWVVPRPGLTVILTGHLSPPSGPIEPYGFDFRRSAWFSGLGAVGYTRTPVLTLKPAQISGTLRLYQLRQSIAQWLRARMEGEASDVAAALIVGERSGLDGISLANLRAANLAHLLAISGLHMGLLTGLVFGASRGAFALWPRAALYWPVKKIAAAIALIAGMIYLGLSGANVATQRAFIMVAMVFVAVLLDRRALTLRAVAIAALVVMVLSPVSVTGPGFQMSFAATTALVAIFAQLRGRFIGWPAPLRWLITLFISSLVAGVATGPFGAAHFNIVSRYGLLANLASVPLMGAVVMPAALISFALAPLGLEGPALWVMEQGINWILAVAAFTAAQDGSVAGVLAPMPAVLPLMSIGGLLVLLLKGWPRAFGLIPLVAALGLWVQTERPFILISDTGSLIGVLEGPVRMLSKPKGDGFSANGWLENDGSRMAREDGPLIAPSALRRWRVTAGETDIVLVTGKTALAELSGCEGADILVSNQRVDASYPCDLYDAARLVKTGALAIDRSGRLTSVRDVTGQRLWAQ